MGANRLRKQSRPATTVAVPRRMTMAFLLAALWSSIGPIASVARGGPGPMDGAGDDAPPAVVARRPPAPATLARARIPSDDWTFRPTVVVRRGDSQGSGTIIASVDNQTLVLTAAHVVGQPGPISVELHLHNFGLERTPAPGDWPRPVGAQLAAIDRAADLAILRIEELAPVPYVARLAPLRREVTVDSNVTSIGIDLGAHLSGWSTRLVEALWFELNDNREERLFLITARPPEHGRSGGGLFLPNGELVGVCIGHAELVRGRRQGVFASRESIRQLLIDHDLISVITRSELRQSRLN
jgi:S1-C subfamily serine protease